MEVRLLHDSRLAAVCSHISFKILHNPCKSDTRKWDDHDWMEWQANHLSAAVLMPKCSVDLLARSCKDKLKTPTSRAILIAKMSDCFDVSIQAATNRLKDLGYIKTNDTTDYSYASAIMDFAGVVGS